MEKKLFDILKERGYVKDLTHEQEIIDLVNGEPMTFYLGIDPTADSLHIGHFFALTMFRWLQDFGHHGIILIGGATALIGDPTGKSDMRKMLSKEEVAHNKAEVKELVKRFVRTDGDNPAIIVDNADWICDKTYVDPCTFENVGTELMPDYRCVIDKNYNSITFALIMNESNDIQYLENDGELKHCIEAKENTSFIESKYIVPNAYQWQFLIIVDIMKESFAKIFKTKQMKKN